MLRRIVRRGDSAASLYARQFTESRATDLVARSISRRDRDRPHEHFTDEGMLAPFTVRDEVFDGRDISCVRR